ncbi:hypothetical protein [Mesorhizobium qingshengii]|uniref:Uncharacterized protein n=1 Tax=Mesorhizobium qingshengii TaxID=1165689 RepID=A0A1G5V1J1_9HYPH|nr:hypothetical protein [Mesorhizobium qingshengii]SDA39137.1 hypothetical protein SAMN02927914_00115 [Mesorhizobium qingshengii]
MAQITKPLAGGSYIRGKDGSLKKVAGTEAIIAVPLADPDKTAAPVQTSETGTAVPATTPRKGK